MSQTKKNVIIGQLIFAFLTVSILVTIFAAQAEVMVMMFVCAIVSIVMSLGLLMLLLQVNKKFEENIQEVVRLKQRENNQLKKKQRIIDNIGQQHTEEFNVDEAFTRIMPAAGSDLNNIVAYTEQVLQNIAKEMEIVQGLVFVLNDKDQLFHISGEYAYYSEDRPRSFSLGETLSGQVAKNRKILTIKELPEGYITVLSGLGKSHPRQLIIIPIVYNHKSIGIMELASFKPFGENEELLLRNVGESMANLLNEIRNHL